MLCQRQQALNQGHGQIEGPLFRQGHGYDRGQGATGHRRQVAEVDRQGLAADAAGIVAGKLEIDVVGEHIDRERTTHHARHAQHGGVVARPQSQQRMGRQSPPQPGNKFGFHSVYINRQGEAVVDAATAAAGCRRS